MDVKAMMDAVVGLPWTQLAAVTALLVAASYAFKKFGQTEGSTKKRQWGSLFENWQLLLLASTAFVLSCASGWTTWDGMRNFTGEPVLSGMVTFGIQGVMLIVAWIIGETFATGMNRQAPNRRGRAPSLLDRYLGPAQVVVGFIAGTLLFVALFIAAMQWFGAVNLADAQTYRNGFGPLVNQLLFGAVVLLFAATLLLNSQSDVVEPYVQSIRVMAKSTVLWVMFLACMATSVFFSFDSLFSTIFPQSERVRAGEIRAQNQVAGIVSDVGGMITNRQLTETEGLFATDGWKAFDGHLGNLARAAKKNEGAVQRYFEEQMELRRRGIAQQQERIASSQSGQAGLSSKKGTLTDELSRLKGERPALAAEYAEKKSALDTRAKEIDAKRVDAMAEDKGVEGTGKVGKGPIYRERLSEMGKLQDFYKIGEERVRDAQKRLTAVDTRVAQIERELAGVDGDLAKLKGEATTAEQRIKLAEDAKTAEEGVKITDPSLMLPRFERARAEFRQSPSEVKLGELQGLCVQMFGAMASTPSIKQDVAGIDCDPKSAAEASARVFALNSGSEVFGKTCVGGDKLALMKTADDLFGFARKCVQDSGLASKDTDALRTKINSIELGRDDKANRFVVTLNAFNDGNKLAYLALAIAIAIDSLVFMSGLFGANALRSPLSDVPSTKARSAAQLEATINAALGARPFENANLALDAMRPMTNTDGFSSYVDLSGLGRNMADPIRRVLSAGADIGAVETVANGGRETYRVRGELREYLSTICDRHLKSDDSFVVRAKLENIVRVALMPHPKEHSELVIHYMEPIKSDVRGFSSELAAGDAIADAYDRRIVHKVMNAAATQNGVTAVKGSQGLYLISPQLYETLANIYAGDPPSANYHADRERAERTLIGGPRTGTAYGGQLGSDRAQLDGANPGQRQIPKQQAAASQQSQRAPFDAKDLRGHFWSSFLVDLSLDPGRTIHRMSGNGVPDAARDAWQALDRQGGRNGILKKHLDSNVKALEDRVSETYARLKSESGDDQRMIDILDEIDQEVREVSSVLMLLPEVKLVPFLIEQLERAAQPDEGLLPGEQSLKDILVNVNAVLRSADLANADSWKRISAMLAIREETSNNDLPAIVVQRQNRRGSLS